MYHITCWRYGYWQNLGRPGQVVAAVRSVQDNSAIEYALAYCDDNRQFDFAIRRAVKRARHKGKTYNCIPINLERRPLGFEMHDLVTSALEASDTWAEFV